MKIGIIVDNELNNDIRVLREIGILNEFGFEIYVLCFAFSRKTKNPINQISITRISIGKRLKNILFFFLNTIPLYEWIWTIYINRFIGKNKIDVLHVHDLYMSKASHNGIKMAGSSIPMVLDLHENYPFSVTTYNWTKGFFRNLFSQPEKWRKKEKEYLEYANRIIVLSYEYRDVLIEKYPQFLKDTFTVLPNVPDLSLFENKNRKVIPNPFSSNYSIIIYYGVIAERRGVFDALEVFKNLTEENYPINFLLIGPVDKKDKSQFLEMINTESIKEQVHYIPWIDSGELFSYLDICDICIAPFHKNPQHESGIANKIFDYMLAGKPLIVSDCKPQQELIQQHKCGLVFENMVQFRDAIIILIENKELRNSLGKNGHEAIINKYHTGIVKDNLLKLYNTITNNR
jgi:glycosyltransferase involved in cell wall biosynthesis